MAIIGSCSAPDKGRRGRGRLTKSETSVYYPMNLLVISSCPRHIAECSRQFAGLRHESDGGFATTTKQLFRLVPYQDKHECSLP